jgi:putative membrane protein
MDGLLRDHVEGVAATLSVVSIALVVAAVRGLVPSGLLPRASEAVIHAIPTVNAAISVVAIATIVYGVRAIRAGRIRAHRRAMLTALALFVTFLVLYLYRVTLEGPTAFGGPDILYTVLYLPLLVVHMGLAIVCIPLLYYVLLLAATHPVAALPATPHPRVGRVAAGLWVVSFAMGIGVYLLLYVGY